MAGQLDGRVAVVTGGASGIGRACALRFAQEGADIVVADLDAERAASTVSAVEAEGRRALFVETDTSREADNEALAQATLAHFGRINVLLAAAGISHAGYVSGLSPTTWGEDRDARMVVAKPLERWERVLAVNLTGVMLTNRAVAQVMIAADNGGAIVNIASGAARIPLAGAADYCVSKAGVWMLTKVLALELAPHHIRVNAIGPGMIETPMTVGIHADEELKQRAEKNIPLGRLGQPEDIANTALFLASDQASFMSGQLLHPDGGIYTS